MEPASSAISSSFRKYDLAGTVFAALALAGGAVCGFVGERSMGTFKIAYSEVGDSELPMITRAVFALSGNHVLDVLILALLLAGIYLLVTIKDRLRANLYAALVGITLIGWSATMLFAALIPLINIVSSMANQG